MKFNKDDFDTSILQTETYKLYLDKTDNVSSISRKIETVKKGLICCFTPANVEYTGLLESLGFHFVSIRSTYKRMKEPIGKNILPKGYSISTIDSSTILTDDEIRELVLPIYLKNRFCKDPLIPRDKGLQIYEQWFKNSLYHDYANKCFLASYEGKSVGICTAKIDASIGIVDLLAVVSKHRGKHLGTCLLQKTMQYFYSQETNSIEVIVEGDNLGAIIVYQKNNFILHDVQLVYHKHL